MSARAPRRRVVGPVLGLVVAIAALVAGCGLQNDDAPRDIEAADAPNLAQQTPGTQASSGGSVRLYFLDQQSSGQPSRLHPTAREVAPSPKAVFEALVAGLTVTEQSSRLRTAIPSGLRLVTDPVQTGAIVTLDLDESIFLVSGVPLVDSIAQIVFTMSALPRVEGVQLLVNGQRQEWPTGDGSGTSDPLTEFDYPERNPTSQPDYPSAPAPGTVAPTSEPDTTTAPTTTTSVPDTTSVPAAGATAPTTTADAPPSS